jgi:uncharacterized RDD family membrane protein YckC
MLMSSPRVLIPMAGVSAGAAGKPSGSTGLLLARSTGLLTNNAEVSTSAVETPVVDFLLSATSTIFSWAWVSFALFLGACVAANRYAQRIHRRVALPRILRGVRNSTEANAPTEAEVKANPQDAVVVHKTTYASTMRRVGGYFIDYFVQLTIALGALGLIVKLQQILGMDANDTPFAGAWFAFIFVFSWLYGTLQIASKQQATLGMRAVGIFRTDLHGGRLSFRMASAWWLYRILSCVLYFLGFISQPFTRRRQTLHDWLAGSVVLRFPQATVPQG